MSASEKEKLFHDLCDGITRLEATLPRGVLANLEIFTQRLAQEDSRELHAWHPMRESQVDRIKVECKDNQQLKPRYLSRQETDEAAA